MTMRPMSSYPGSGVSSLQVCVGARHWAAFLAHLNCGRMSRCRNHLVIALSPFCVTRSSTWSVVPASSCRSGHPWWWFGHKTTMCFGVCLAAPHGHAGRTSGTPTFARKAFRPITSVRRRVAMVLSGRVMPSNSCLPHVPHGIRHVGLVLIARMAAR